MDPTVPRGTRKKIGSSVEFAPFVSSYTQKARKHAGGEHDIPTDHHPSSEILRRSRHFWSGDGPGKPGLLPLERRHLVRAARSRSRDFLGSAGWVPGFLPASRARLDLPRLPARNAQLARIAGASAGIGSLNLP